MNDPKPIGDGQQDPPSDGRPPQQTDDIQRAIRAARNNQLCNQKVVLLGFSGGAGHAAWWAIAGATGTDKPEAVVGCSGPYDLNNDDILDILNNRNDIVNYIGVDFGDPQFEAAAKAASSYWLPFTSTPCPVLLFNSECETIPQSEMWNMAAHLSSPPFGGTVETHLLLGNLHGSEYWCSDYGEGTTVKQRSIDFLKGVLGMQ